MKKSYLIVVLSLTWLLGLGISAHAQDTEGVRVNVPFEFVAGGTTLPAGTYTVGRPSRLVGHDPGHSWHSLSHGGRQRRPTQFPVWR